MEKTQEESGTEQSKKLEDFTIAELLNMKEDIEEEYGKGVFEKQIYPNIARLFGHSKLKNDQVPLTKEKMNSEWSAAGLQGNKTFAEVPLDGTARDSKTLDDCVPLKPISAPRMAGGNVVIEIDEEEYHRGVDELKYSVIGKLTLSHGEEAPTTKEIRRKLSEF